MKKGHLATQHHDYKGKKCPEKLSKVLKLLLLKDELQKNIENILDNNL
ncbi:MAG: hypothetical protein H8E98_05250 [Bacteroidetes bacterium]|nr:hypothetical protein [Bacteroidota bacterium]